MKKNALLTAIVVALLAGCNSSDNSSPDRDTTPGNPGIPALPGGGDDGGNEGGDQTDPDGDHDLNPPKDPLIIEAAQRWGTTYEEMYAACQLWTCSLGAAQERMTFMIERETQLIEGKARITFTLSENRPDFWPSYIFYSDLIQQQNVEIESLSSLYSFVDDDKIQNRESILLGWKTGVDNWTTYSPRRCEEVYCSDFDTSLFENAAYSNTMAVYRTDGTVTHTQRVYLTKEELNALYPVFNPTFPSGQY
ncbi:hypothetical protein QTO05_23010 [Vibrio fortis]|uniref:hypothetical protein n=1 Tax=Vibrio fortis TaxID=212667 RepID=UPI002F424A42